MRQQQTTKGETSNRLDAAAKYPYEFELLRCGRITRGIVVFAASPADAYASIRMRLEQGESPRFAGLCKPLQVLGHPHSSGASSRR